MTHALGHGVVCRNKGGFERKLETLRRAGYAKLHAVTDFDMTLTRGRVEGKKVHTALSQLREGGYLGAEYARDSQELRDLYYPIEVNHKLSVEKKRVAMRRWHRAVFALMRRHGLTQEILARMMEDAPLSLREGVPEFFAIADTHHVPSLVFSAGLGEIVESTLKDAGCMLPNVHILSNFLAFDDKGRMTGSKDPVVCMHNKSEKLIAGTPYESAVSKRANVLLMGDNPGDLDMATGLTNEAVLSLGFLNGDSASLEHYLGIFDAVVVEDGDFSFATTLLQEIGKK